MDNSALKDLLATLRGEQVPLVSTADSQMNEQQPGNHSSLVTPPGDANAIFDLLKTLQPVQEQQQEWQPPPPNSEYTNEDSHLQISDGFRESGPPPPHHDGNGAPAMYSHHRRDVRHLTFAESLPLLGELATDPVFLDAIAELRSEQESLELSLLDERHRLKADLTRNPRRRNTKAELEACDHSILQRFDQLVAEQQRRLQQLHVPGYFMSSSKSDIERQRKILGALVTIMDEAA